MASSMLEKDIDEVHRQSSDVLMPSQAKGGGEVDDLNTPSQPLESSMNDNNNGSADNGGALQDANSEWVTAHDASKQNLYEKYNVISRRDIYICVILVIGMIAVTAIALAVAVKKHNQTSEEQSALPAELEGRVQFDPVTNEWVSSYVLPTRPVPTTITDQEELDLIIDTLTNHPLLAGKVADLPKTVTELAAIRTVTDPYVLGAQWLTNTDTYNGKEHTIDRYALAVFYYSLTGETWHNRTNWLSPTEYYCNWYGVVCCNEHVRTSTLCNSNEFGKIIELDLFRNNLIGSIPDVISLFNSTLYSLYLSENSITGTIPGAAIATLSQFGALQAAYNFLTGTIPEELNTNGIFSKYNLISVAKCIGVNLFVSFSSSPLLYSFVYHRHRYITSPSK
jgi:hypothetical protein